MALSSLISACKVLCPCRVPNTFDKYHDNWTDAETNKTAWQCDPRMARFFMEASSTRSLRCDVRHGHIDITWSCDIMWHHCKAAVAKDRIEAFLLSPEVLNSLPMSDLLLTYCVLWYSSARIVLEPSWYMLHRIAGLHSAFCFTWPDNGCAAESIKVGVVGGQRNPSERCGNQKCHGKTSENLGTWNSTTWALQIPKPIPWLLKSVFKQNDEFVALHSAEVLLSLSEAR